jgi:hypothetical protein
MGVQPMIRGLRICALKRMPCVAAIERAAENR